jgi:hypothetical protein
MDEEVRVFMAEHEYETYLEHCPRRTRLASRIMGETSPRRGITVELTPNDFFVPDDPDVELAFVKLRETKDSTEGENALGGKTRISWVPWDLYEEVQQYCEDEGIEDDEQIFDITGDWLKSLVKEAAEATAVATGNQDYEHLRPHDLRAYYATNMLQRLNVDIETVMAMGGWGSRKAIDPYLAKPLPRDLQDDLASAGLVQKDVPEPQRNDKLGQILDRLNQIERALNLQDVVDLKDLTRSDVHAIKEQVENEATEAERSDVEKTKSLLDFLNAATPGTALVLGMVASAMEALGRVRYERSAMAETPTTPSPVGGAAAYALGLLLVLTPIMISSGAVFSPDVAATAVGGVIGSARFDFDNPRTS